MTEPKSFRQRCYEAVNQEVWRQMLEMMGNVRGRRVLFVGCGTSFSLCRDLLERGADLWCLDVSSASIDQLMRQPWGSSRRRLHLCVASAEDTGLPSGAFDVVVGKAILHHLDMKAFLPELGRVAVAGARIVFSEPLQGSPPLRLFRRLTPNHRVPSERPFRRTELAAIRAGCSEWTIRHNFLLATAAMPLMLAGLGRLGERVFEAGLAGDRLVFSLIPPARWWAWNVTFSGQLNGSI